MARISSRHLRMQRSLHAASYGVSGWKWAVPVAVLAGETGASTILDYGAGKGTLSKVLADHFDVRNYDPVTFPDAPGKADIVVCTDVLENVEPDGLDEVLCHIGTLAQKGIFIAIALHPEEKNRDGLVRRDPEEWFGLLRKFWPNGRADIVGTGTKRARFIVTC